MNNNTVKNPKVEVPSSKQMNDCDFLNCALMTEKSLSNNYSVALNELSNDLLYTEMFKVYKDTQECQRLIFNLLFKKGWYELENADQNKMQQKYNEYNKKLQDINQ